MNHKFLLFIISVVIAATAFGISYSSHLNPASNSNIIKQQLALSPQVTGKLVLGQQVLSHTKVTRTLTVGAQYFEQTVYTDAQGQFSFAPFTAQVKTKLQQASPRIWQDIKAVHNETDYSLWYTALSNEQDNQFIAKPLSTLECDLLDNNDHQILEIDHPHAPLTVFSICTTTGS